MASQRLSSLSAAPPIAPLRPMAARHAHAQAPWPMHSAHAAFISWERPSPNGRASRLPTTAQRSFGPNGSSTMIGLGVRYPASNTPSPLPESRTISQFGSPTVSQAGTESPKPHFLEISPGAGNSNFVKLFARRALPLSSPSPPPQQCWPCCRSRDRRASRCSCTVLARCSQGMRSPLMAP